MIAWLMRLLLVASGIAVFAGSACLIYRSAIECLRALGLSGDWLSALTTGPLPPPSWALALSLIAGGVVLFILLLIVDTRGADRREAGQ